MTDDAASRPGDRWRQYLRRSTIPQPVLDRSPEPGATLEPGMFRWRPDLEADQPERPSRRRALEALPEGGSVLDVGVGGGASSLGLASHAGLIVGVDVLPDMLDQFEASGREAGVATRAVCGAWPEVADQVEAVDVAVSHHAVYVVADIERFLAALTAKARRRVVIEVSTHPPLIRFNPMFRAFHGFERLDWPVADEAHAVARAMGLDVEREDLVLPPRTREVTPEFVAFARHRLHVGPERNAEIEEFLRNLEPEEQTVVALWWSGAA
jgi:SAM-dependent methyltransferase